MSSLRTLVLLLIASLAIAAWSSRSLKAGAAKNDAEAKELTLNLSDGIGLRLVQIPPGRFLMGSRKGERGRHDDEGVGPKGEARVEVTISRQFYMGVTPVTVDQFAAFVKDSGYKTDAEKDGWSVWLEIRNGDLDFTRKDGCSWRNPSFAQTGNDPVVQVSWNDAKAFCDWLSKKSGKTVCLPTEAQWEYACRAGATAAYPWGVNPDGGKGWANCADQTIKGKLPNVTIGTFFNWDDGFVFTSPVGSFKANAFGLHDMVGNVWQWCADRYGNYEKDVVVDPTGAITGDLRVRRGGYWGSGPGGCRLATRSGSNADSRSAGFGFRVAVVAAGVD